MEAVTTSVLTNAVSWCIKGFPLVGRILNYTRSKNVFLQKRLFDLQDKKDESEHRLLKATSATIAHIEQNKCIPMSTQYEFNAAYEFCASSWDRLSEHIIKHYLDDESIRSRHFKCLRNLVEERPDQFRQNTPYRFVRTLYSHWWPTGMDS